MSDPATPTARVPRAWLVPMLLVVVAAEVAVELAYLRWPMPPGVDPADWIQRSYAWVGLPAVTPDAVGSPYLYPPVMFPLLGAVVRLTGSAVATGYLFGGLLLIGYGLTTIHLARRFLTTGPTQLLFVGLAMLNGTTLSMLFWGGYPNFLALIFVNEALVFLRAFVTTRGLRDGLIFYGLLALVYLTHDLTFIVLGATVGFAALLFTLHDRGFLLRMLKARPTWIGIPVVVATVLAYVAALHVAQIEAPSYFGSNPAAYDLDNLGRYFGPLAGAPVFTPLGPVVNLDPGVVEALLVGVALLLFGGAYLANRRAGARVTEWTIAAALAMAALLVPVVGWAAHVDTDYTRFVYFVPLPAALGLALVAEGLLAKYREVRSAAGVPTTTEPAPLPARPGGAVLGFDAGVAVAVGIVLLFLLAAVALPTISTNESADAGPSHDAAFLASLRYLAGDPTPGSVLTLQSSVRWVEAVSSRGAFDVGPTWLLFEPWQIVNAEESYWAFNTQVAVTNNHDVLGFSGGYLGVDSSPIIAAPVYAAYLDGVAVPLVDLTTADLLVNVTTPNGTAVYPAGFWHPPVLTEATDGTAAASLAFAGPYFDVLEEGVAAAAGGATIRFEVTPSPGVVVNALQVRLGMPSASVSLLHPPASAGATAAGGTVSWITSEAIGPELSSTSIRTTIAPSPAPAALAVSGASGPDAASFTFDASGGGALAASLAFATAGTSNPAIELPPVLNTSSFLAEHQIGYLLLPTKSGYQYTAAYYHLLFGFSIVYTNAEWTVLAR